ncbi:MAG: prolyl oligopeptidase family serine peptidase [Candidatus Acidiferrales bacterium]|jgi:prolyl oligopeptidase
MIDEISRALGVSKSCARAISGGIIRIAVILFAMLAAIPASTFAQETAMGKCPPETRKDDVVDTIHGVSVTDPYRWLEDQKSPETRAWIEAEDKCTAAVLDAVPGRAEISKRFTELMKVESVGLPRERHGVYFFSKRSPDQQLYIIYKREGLHGKDEVLIDPHPLSPDHSTSVGLMDVSSDGSLLAYNVRTGGQDEVTVHFLDVKTAKALPDELPHADYFGLSLEPDNRGAYYTRMTPDGPRVLHHVIGTDAKTDAEIFGKGFGTDKIISSKISEDGSYLVIDVIYGSGSTRAEVYLKDLKSSEPVKAIVNDLDSLFFGDIEGGTVYLMTNWKAPHWHIYSVDPKRPARDAWTEVIPESDATIQNFGLYGGKMLVEYVRNATSQLHLFEVNGKSVGDVALPALGSVNGTTGRWENGHVFFDFHSFNMPDTILSYEIKTGTLDTWQKSSVPIDSAKYTVEQVWYESKDKTRVPMFLFYKKGLVRDGARPVVLTGYGGFNVSNTPSFSALGVVLADQGGIYALANLRGGGEFGEAWHHAGMMENKQNVFDDFIAAGEWLIANKYTSSSKLAIAGGSNGGLLVGAAMTQRPDLFQAVVCLYPLLDMVRFQKFPPASWWVPEYGSSDDAAQFKYILAYSPYQNVKDGTKYPATLFVTGDGDTRVNPLHARKMAARVQAANASDHPILLLYDTKSGHSGGRPLNKEIEENSDIASFLFSQLGVNAK